MNNTRNKIIVSIAVLLVAVQAGLLYLWSEKRERFQAAVEAGLVRPIERVEPDPGGMSDAPALRSYSLDPAFYDEAYDSLASSTTGGERIYGGIVPHHLFVKDKIAGWFEGLKRVPARTVVLVAPNHTNAGPRDIIIAAADHLTPYGRLETDRGLFDRLKNIDYIAADDQTMAAEPSPGALTPFIKKTWPAARVFVVLVKRNAASSTLDDLAGRLKDMIDPENDIMIGTIDFSHYQSAYTAAFHDRASIQAVRNFDYDRFNGLEIDAPGVLRLAARYLDRIGARSASLIDSSDTSELLGRPDEPGTSHQYFYYRRGDADRSAFFNGLFFGDLMLDRHVGERIARGGLAPLLDSLAGEEGRFFLGPDLVSANLEGAVTDGGAHYPPTVPYDFAFAPDLIGELRKWNFSYFSNANNHLADQGSRGIIETGKNLDALGFAHSGCTDAAVGDCSSTVVTRGGLKIGLAGFSQVYHSLDEAAVRTEIERLARATDLVVVNIHWGREYEHEYAPAQERLGRLLIDAGADLVIGHHPHVVQGATVYKGKPIFYSLGNFIFDQYFSADTQEGLAVGAHWQDGEWHVSLFPFKSESSHVRAMVGEERSEFLQRFAGWSVLDTPIKDRIIKKGEFGIMEQ